MLASHVGSKVVFVARSVITTLVRAGKRLDTEVLIDVRFKGAIDVMRVGAKGALERSLRHVRHFVVVESSLGIALKRAILMIACEWFSIRVDDHVDSEWVGAHKAFATALVRANEITLIIVVVVDIVRAHRSEAIKALIARRAEVRIRLGMLLLVALQINLVKGHEVAMGAGEARNRRDKLLGHFSCVDLSFKTSE